MTEFQERLLDVLEGIRWELQCIGRGGAAMSSSSNQRGIIEEGFMILHDKIDDVAGSVASVAEALEKDMPDDGLPFMDKS